MNEEIIKAIRKQILMGGKETLVDAIYLIFENHQEDLLNKIERDFVLDKKAHSQGRCSFSSVALCSAMEQEAKQEFKQLLQ